MIATTTRKGTVPPGYGAAWVTFNDHNSTKPPKTYCYWTPPHWHVAVGDQLHVIVSERSEHKVVTVTELGIAPMGAEHKIAKSHLPVSKRNTAVNADDLMDFKHVRPMISLDVLENKAAGDGLIFHGYDAALLDDRITDWPPPHNPTVQRHIERLRAYQQRMYESMAVPPRMITPEQLRHHGTATGRINLPGAPFPDNIPKETTVMINMETVTYLNGKPIQQATDAEMFEAIRKTEAEIKGLTDIHTKPKALKERILKLQADIDALVAYMDAR